MKLNFLKEVQTLLQQPICDHCLGRACGHLVSGFTNKERGQSIRHTCALLLDSGESMSVDMSNFQHYKFIHVAPTISNMRPCIICDNFFSKKIDEISSAVMHRLEEYQFSSFVIGCTQTEPLDEKFKIYFPSLNLAHKELFKKEINRELGKKIEKKTKKRVKLQNPDMMITINLLTESIKIYIRSLFIQGTYQKLTRVGVAQATWYCMRCIGPQCDKCQGTGRLYATSLQEIIGDPLQKMSQGIGTAFHGSGREDVDVRCFGYRPFVLEIKNPKIRTIDLSKITTTINKSKKVQVYKLKFSNKKYVRKIKEATYDKTYSADVSFFKGLGEKKDLDIIHSLNRTTIAQWTPTRVQHRRANLERKRMVRRINYKILSPKNLRITIRGESGLYIKELIHGDNGRTQPSISQLIHNHVRKIALDVITIHT